MCHSTETALLRVHNDLTRAPEHKQMDILLLLDLSAAFDTVKHNILLDRLSGKYGIRGDALRWIKSYLSEREQFVALGKFCSPSKPLETGIPQGSVLGPLLFTLYISPLADITKHHNLDSHFYADDSQLNVFFDRKVDIQDNIKLIEECVKEIKVFMMRNCLEFNEDKTEIVSFGSDYNMRQLSSIEIKIGE